MRSHAGVIMAIMAALALGTAVAEERVTLDGTIVCAKCTLKRPDAKECQNVLLVTEGGKDVEYYLAKSEAVDKVGEVCTEKKKATVTGVVSEKNGRKWITASKVDTKT